MKIKKTNCFIAALIILLSFWLGQVFSGPGYSFPSNEYIRKGDWVVKIDPALVKLTPEEEKTDESKWITPNGWPKAGEWVRVLEVRPGHGGLVIENYPTYLNNELGSFDVRFFRKVK